MVIKNQCSNLTFYIFKEKHNEGGILRKSLRGGIQNFFLRRFVLSGLEMLKIHFSYRQWIDIHTKKKQSQKVNLRPKLAHI